MCVQWSSQVIGIGRAPVVRLTIALTTLALTPTYHDLRAGRLDERWPGTCPARPGLRYATVCVWEGGGVEGRRRGSMCVGRERGEVCVCVGGESGFTRETV